MQREVGAKGSHVCRDGAIVEPRLYVEVRRHVQQVSHAGRVGGAKYFGRRPVEVGDAPHLADVHLRGGRTRRLHGGCTAVARRLHGGCTAVTRRLHGGCTAHRTGGGTFR